MTAPAAMVPTASFAERAGGMGGMWQQTTDDIVQRVSGAKKEPDVTSRLLSDPAFADINKQTGLPKPGEKPKRKNWRERIVKPMDAEMSVQPGPPMATGSQAAQEALTPAPKGGIQDPGYAMPGWFVPDRMPESIVSGVEL
jgi:hypothetical protein